MKPVFARHRAVHRRIRERIPSLHEADPRHHRERRRLTTAPTRPRAIRRCLRQQRITRHYYSAVSNFEYINRPNTQTISDCVIARAAGPRQSRRPCGLPRRAARAMTILFRCFLNYRPLSIGSCTYGASRHIRQAHDDQIKPAPPRGAACFGCWTS
jgi:hypothetical protein